ncbi:MAG: signal peptidase II, partial [Firmicutes bacterium]|nr:signal peptidase II [Bacillota bacterium]
HFTYVQNRGAAFSMWQEQWIILILLPLTVIAAGLIVMFIKRNTWDKLMLTSVAMICGGGLGNLIDRIMLGYVVDLFDFRVFPVFNIADIFICVGCGLMILDVLFFERKNSSNE